MGDIQPNLLPVIVGTPVLCRFRALECPPVELAVLEDTVGKGSSRGRDAVTFSVMIQQGQIKDALI